MSEPGYASVRLGQQRIERRAVRLAGRRDRCLQLIEQPRQALAELKVAGLPAEQRDGDDLGPQLVRGTRPGAGLRRQVVGEQRAA
jgi:hypothetical protein